MRERTRSVMPAVVAFVVIVGLWEALIRIFDIESFILPRPSDILTQFFANAEVIWGAGWRTLQEALGGLVIGTVAGVVASLAAARWVLVRDGLLPIAVAASAMPIVVLAPIMNQWFSSTSPLSKMMVVSVMVFFPVMINTTRGLVEVDRGAVELMRSFASKPRQVLTRVQVPGALPYFFSALKVATSLSLIGAIVAEYFGGPQDVLGQYIVNRANLFQFADAWAAILVASLLGIALFVAASIVERLVMPWHVSLRAGAST